LAAPPYDVVTREEATRLAAGNPLCFFRVSRAEIELPAEVDPHDARVHRRARENLDRLVAEGALARDAAPSLYLYREAMEGRAQVGVVGCVHVDDYEAGIIRTHETTRPDKEDDRTRHLLALDAHPEPVLLAHRDVDGLGRLGEADMAGPALYDFRMPDGVRHTVWRVSAPAPWVAAFAGLTCAYIADGHHRSAAARRAAAERRAATGRRGDQEHDWFPAVLVPASQLRVLGYHRLVKDLGGRPPGEVLERLARVGRLSPAADAAPPRPGAFGLYVAGRWHRLALEEASIERDDPVRSLDVSLLQERVLGPVLGIRDQRTDARLDFVGGPRAIEELERRVDAREAALAVACHPVTVEQLMTVSDAGRVMPPKSTWFEPKLLSGLFLHPLG
jgi:uncharacterized protein (DUF1015 family)